MRYYKPWHYTHLSYTLPNVKQSNNLIQMGAHIKRIRKMKGWSQEELAANAGVDRSYMGGIERGERNVSFLTLVKIADCMGCSVADFSKGIPNERT